MFVDVHDVAAFAAVRLHGQHCPPNVFVYRIVQRRGVCGVGNYRLRRWSFHGITLFRIHCIPIRRDLLWRCEFDIAVIRHGRGGGRGEGQVVDFEPFAFFCPLVISPIITVRVFYFFLNPIK